MMKSYDYDGLQNESRRIIEDFAALIAEAEASLKERAPVLKRLRSKIKEYLQKDGVKIGLKEQAYMEKKSKALDEELERNLPDSLKAGVRNPGLSKILASKLRI